MKARLKGTDEWKEYKEVFGPHGVFQGLETIGATKSIEEQAKERGIDQADKYAMSRLQPYYLSAVLPIECFDLWEEPNWERFRREAAKDFIAANMVQNGQDFYSPRCHPDIVKRAINLADELIKQLKEYNK